MRRASAACVLALSLAACACGTETTQAPADERADVARLQAALTEDPAQLVLDEVDDAVARQRPVIAADLLEDAAIPAVRRHIQSLQALPMGTSEGATLRTRAIRLLRRRETALLHWQAALSRGIGHDDEVLLDALHETSEAERELAAFHTELAEIRPLETGEGPADRSGALEGLPPLEPPTSGEGDDTVTPPSEPDPHGADPIDGREETDEPVVPPSLRAPHEPELPTSPTSPVLPEDLEDHHAQ